MMAIDSIKRTVFNVLAVVFVPLCFFAAVEAFLHIFPGEWFEDFAFFAGSIENDLEKYSFLQADPQILWKPVPGFDGTASKNQSIFNVKINSEGWRCSEYDLKPPKDVLRILILGDSITFGLMVEGHETFGALIEERLNRDNPLQVAQVINMSAPGYSTFQGLRLLKTEGLKLTPDIVIVCFGINDPQHNYPLSDREIFERIGRMHQTKRLLHKLRFYQVMKRGGLLLTNNFKSLKPRVSPREMESNLIEMGRLVEDDGARFILIRPPEGSIRAKKRLMTINPIIKRVAFLLEVPLIYTPQLDYDTIYYRSSYFGDNIHPIAIGHKFIAKKILETIQGQ